MFGRYFGNDGRSRSDTAWHWKLPGLPPRITSTAPSEPFRSLAQT